MKGTNLGEFEEIVMLTIAALHEGAYGVAIKETIEERTKRNVSVGAMYSALNRLESKGFVDSEWGESTQERGGKRKRLFTLTIDGKKALIEAKNLRDELWGLSEQFILGNEGI
ncbi:helix-turn-helix transcriptional regulator [Fulvivirgaceae bacterium BMA10]|uniref:Helix-turn-helix transcriptional regulator n=1 Tax=Splendidivirga corallicola TaxID=3051826 RepID=A0ABT8KSJ8_9BACT|nr:helix-turn-helix transcriptional regulator [Fulvivirgaceae bacterium BMA10]